MNYDNERLMKRADVLSYIQCPYNCVLPLLIAERLSIQTLIPKVRIMFEAFCKLMFDDIFIYILNFNCWFWLCSAIQPASARDSRRRVQASVVQHGKSVDRNCSALQSVSPSNCLSSMEVSKIHRFHLNLKKFMIFNKWSHQKNKYEWMNM